MSEELLLFIDSEGTPVQELAAILVDTITMSIKDTFLQWAFPEVDTDWYARKHVHGLSRSFLRHHGLENEKKLLESFHAWRNQYTINEIFAHAPVKEEILLNLKITDACLLPWAERDTTPAHRIALRMKNDACALNGIVCEMWRVHNEYKGWPRLCGKGDYARSSFGPHCAWFDSIEVMLTILPDMTSLASTCSPSA